MDEKKMNDLNDEELERISGGVEQKNAGDNGYKLSDDYKVTTTGCMHPGNNTPGNLVDVIVKK
jgi:hypothetical protein